MMETNTELLKTIRDFIRYCTTRLYSSEATFNHGYQNPEEEAAFLVLRTLRIPLEYEDKFLDAALTNNERETVLNNISRRCDDLEPTAYITKEWWLTGFPFYVDERVLIPRSYIAELIEKILTVFFLTLLTSAPFWICAPVPAAWPFCWQKSFLRPKSMPSI